MSRLGNKTRVAVFRGGTQATNKRSMQHGAVVTDVLSSGSRYQPLDVVVTPSGEWLFEGKVVQPYAFLPQVDAAYVAVLGTYGEDGQLARMLNRFGVPFQTPHPFAALQTWHKDMALGQMARINVRTPKRMVVQGSGRTDLHALSTRLGELFNSQFIVKPLSGTQRGDVHLVANANQLPAVIAKVLSVYPACVVEEYIDGQAITVTLTPSLREQALYMTPAMRWLHTFGADGQLEQDESLELARLSQSSKSELRDTLTSIYKQLDLSGTVRADLQVSKKGDIYFLECNSVAPLSEDAAMTQTLAAVGISPEELIETEMAALR